MRYRLTVIFQNVLHFFGIAWHNNINGECTSDFNCCEDIGRKAIIKFPRRIK